MAKILRRPYESDKAQIPKQSVLLAKNRYYVIITFKLLKIEFKFDYAR